jgi:uncharacterized protein
MARSKYSLLALDGGGIRGVIPARVLSEIETRTGRPIAELFDLVGGTSTGGILALGLTKPGADGGPAYTADDLLGLYMNRGDEIFPNSLVLKVRTLVGLTDPRYPAEPLEALLNERFGQTHLSEALIEVVVPSYDLTGPAPFFFKREYARDEAHTWDVPMERVARATSAAPTYFDPARLPALEDEGDHALIDGGMFANNPAVAAYADALEKWDADSEIHVVSIGTGLPAQTPGDGVIPVGYEAARGWGLARWARPVVEVVFDGVAKAVEYQMKRLCKAGDGPPRWYRLQSGLQDASHALDDASEKNRAALLADAEKLIAQETGKIDEVCAVLADVATDREGN